MLELPDGVRVDFPSPQPPGVDTTGLCRIAINDYIGGDILADDRAPAAEAVGPDPAELVDDGEPPEDGPILDLDVAGKGGRVGHDHLVADTTIMGNMTVGHEEVTAADAGFPCVLRCAPVQGRALADHIAVADGQEGLFTTVFLVLGVLTHRGELKDPVVCPDAGRSADHHMGTDAATGPHAHTRTDDGIGTHFDVGIQLRGRIDDRGGMNRAHKSRAVDMISAVAAISPSTWALPLKRQIPWRALLSCTSTVS